MGFDFGLGIIHSEQGAFGITPRQVRSPAFRLM